MENDNFSNNNVINSDSASNYSTSLTSADWYDYSDVVSREDTIIENQNKTYDLINQGFTFLSFIIVIYFLYLFIKNMIRK